MAAKITAISGFPEYLPAQQRAFDAIAGKIRAAYESFGYTALETAAVERTDVLISKGIDAKEVYGLRRLAAGEGEDGAKELALRFDLTVPTARYVAQNYGQLVFPFRRHQIQPVWRGERPQAGRYRQFHQCDIDYIADGAGALPPEADAEILACAYTALKSLGLKFTIRVNNRKLLAGIFAQHGISPRDITLSAYDIMDDFDPSLVASKAIKVIDDYEKVGLETTISNLVKWTRITKEQAISLIDVLTQESSINIDEHTREGWDELQSVLANAQAMLGHEAKNIIPDYTIARGLDYYTGTVMETKLHEAPELGSICSGGRYENLAESLSERALPGVGISIGLSRLATWLMNQEPWASMAATSADVYVAHGLLGVSEQLRKMSLNVEYGLEYIPLGKQLMKAEKRGHIWAIFGAEGDTVNLRHIPTRKDETLALADVVKRLLSR